MGVAVPTEDIFRRTNGLFCLELLSPEPTWNQTLRRPLWKGHPSVSSRGGRHQALRKNVSRSHAPLCGPINRRGIISHWGPQNTELQIIVVCGHRAGEVQLLEKVKRRAAYLRCPALKSEVKAWKKAQQRLANHESMRTQVPPPESMWGEKS